MTYVYLDHVLIGVRDLDETAAAFGRLGFTMTPEGVHPGRGTHNRLVVFGPEYLEMISVRDPSEVMLRLDLPAFLQSREGLYMFALGTGDGDATAAAMRASGAEVARNLRHLEFRIRQYEGGLVLENNRFLVKSDRELYVIGADGSEHELEPWREVHMQLSLAVVV